MGNQGMNTPGVTPDDLDYGYRLGLALRKELCTIESL